MLRNGAGGLGAQDRPVRRSNIGRQVLLLSKDLLRVANGADDDDGPHWPRTLPWTTSRLPGDGGAFS